MARPAAPQGVGRRTQVTGSGAAAPAERLPRRPERGPRSSESPRLGRTRGARQRKAQRNPSSEEGCRTGRPQFGGERQSASAVACRKKNASKILRRETKSECKRAQKYSCVRPHSPCDPPTLPEPLCLSGASETQSRTERPAQQKRPPSGLRTEASVWHAPSAAAPGQARWRPQGETKHALGALFCVILRGDQNPGGYVEGWQAWTHMPGAAHR